MIPEGRVALGQVANAEFVDIVVRLGKGEIDRFLGVACKNFVGKNFLSPTMIQDEINNFKPVLEHGTGTLLVVATKVQQQIFPGSDLFRVLRGKERKLGLVVPDNMEVVVLSAGGTQEFVGAEVLELLRTQFATPGSGF